MFGRILRLGVPSMLEILMPISASVITRLLSRFGSEAIAAAGTASRIEMFASLCRWRGDLPDSFRESELRC